jgi:Ca2+/Na+ antiporter
MLLILLIGAVLTIVSLVRRRQSWWIALVALVLVVAVWIVGFVDYSQAVSHPRVMMDGVLALGTALLA